MKREPGMHYNTKTLNKVFAFISIVFFIGVMWMFLDDYIRPWKAIQIKSLEIEQKVLNESIALENESIDPEKLAELKNKIDAAEELIENRSREVASIEKELNVIDKDIYAQNMTNGIYGSKSGQYQFQYEHYHMHGEVNKAKEYKVKMEDAKKNFAKGKDILKTFQEQKNEINKRLKEINETKNNLTKELSQLVGKRDRLFVSVDQTKMNPIWFLRNSPFIDYLDPTVKIRQIVPEHLTEDRYFVQTPKVDRCITCHTFIDKKGFESQENPYKTHPRLDELAVGRNSAHPMKKFGCTTCHGGEGHRVFDFSAAAHMPQNPEQEKQWKEDYNWHEPHKIAEPMLPLQYTESSCMKCHTGSERIHMAEKLNKGRKLIENYGCYGCHKADGWEHLEKPGPSLSKINAKVSLEFMKNWIWAPQTFNPNSRMPAYFGQSNNKDPKFMVKNITEVNAMAEYIHAKSKDSNAFATYQAGSADNGKELIQTVGCIACHQVEGIDEPYNKVKSLKGPYLTGTGSKVDPNWLVSWLIKPSHYQADTIMPSFRLSTKEANDIATYLLSLKNKKFETMKFEKLNKKLRDEILVGDYFSQFVPIKTAQAKLDKLSDLERTMELGRLSIGKYGCYSCHNIEGFADNRPPIGPEWNGIGTKFVHQFGFGQQHQVPHRRDAWIAAHLKNPRMWDIGVPKPFKDLNRMPNFYLNNQEIEAMTTTLLGFVKQKIPMEGMKNPSANEGFALEGMKVANKYNCYGCHKIDGLGGDIAAAYEDDLNAGPPWLVDQGHRVNPLWFQNFLKNVTTIRPYMSVRMPSFVFQEGEVDKLVTYFNASAHQSNYVTDPEIVWSVGEKEAAQKMWNAFACTSCHTGGFNNEEAQGPNLHLASKRLRRSWIKKWLTSPVAIQPYTPMPNFWEGGKNPAGEYDESLKGLLNDDPQRQINAMVKYVLSLGNVKESIGEIETSASQEVEEKENIKEAEKVAADKEAADKEAADKEAADKEAADKEAAETEDTKKIDSKKIDSEKIDSEKIDSEKIDSEKIDSKEIDSKEIDSKEIDSKEIDSKEIDSKEATTPEVEETKKEDEK